jgi:hypothetical protein
MALPRLAHIALVALLGPLAACASRARPEGPPAAGGPPLPRSSIAAVILKAEALGLDATQLEALQALDAELQVKVERLRAELAPPPGRGGRPPAGGQGAGETRGGPGGGMGGGPPGGGGGMGGPPGGGMGGPRRGGGGRGSGPDPEAAARFAARLDEEDTSAFLRAEAVLRPEQREAAREIASDYRALRYERRQAERR